MRSIIMILCLTLPATTTPMLPFFCTSCSSCGGGGGCGGAVSTTEKKGSSTNDNQNRVSLSPEQKKAVFTKKYTETFNETPSPQVWNVEYKKNDDGDTKK